MMHTFFLRPLLVKILEADPRSRLNKKPPPGILKRRQRYRKQSRRRRVLICIKLLLGGLCKPRSEP